MDGTEELRHAAALARAHREHVTRALRSGEGTPLMRVVLQRLDRGYAKAAKSLDDVARDLDLLERLHEGNMQ